MQFIQQIALCSLQQNRFKRPWLWGSQGPVASVEVKLLTGVHAREFFVFAVEPVTSIISDKNSEKGDKSDLSYKHNHTQLHGVACMAENFDFKNIPLLFSHTGLIFKFLSKFRISALFSNFVFFFVTPFKALSVIMIMNARVENNLRN